MLRNSNGQNGDITTGILNEVLSLNAQELTTIALPVSKPSVLNEVLSLNAQEFQESPSSLVSIRSPQ